MFLVGLPRSGTTLIEQILASHAQVFGAGEIKLAGDTWPRSADRRGPSSALPVEPRDGPPSRFAALGKASRIQRHGGSHRGQDAGQLLVSGSVGELFPGRIHPLPPRSRDVAVSCWMTRFREIRWASDQQHIASRFHQYQRIMEHWREVLPAPLLEVDYEETVADLEGVARSSWPGAAWNGSRRAWSSTGRSGRSEPPALSRSASRSSGHRWEGGSTTSRFWLRYSPRYPEESSLTMATVPEALAMAIHNHQSGQLQAAEQIYRQILAAEPNHADALHLLGVAAAQAGKYEAAVDYIGRAIRLKGRLPFHIIWGAYHPLRRIPEAIACYRRAWNWGRTLPRPTQSG